MNRIVNHWSNHSVATLSTVSPVNVLACPHHGTGYRNQLDECARQLFDAFEAHKAQPVHLTVFMRDLGVAPALAMRLREIYSRRLPAVTFVQQQPCENALVSIEGMGVAGAHVEHYGEHLTTWEHDGLTWALAAHAYPETRWSRSNTYNQAIYSLAKLDELLGQVGAKFSQVVRTWIYVGNIVADENGKQRYKELNRARSDFFQHVQFPGSRYPASTGIGMAGMDLCMSALALIGHRDDVRTVALENPRQVAAYDYGTHYSPQSPKFSRAMTVAYGDSATTYVSGTASITASETVHLGDAENQTYETLANIAALIGENNLTDHGLPGMGASLHDIGMARVYVKHHDDYRDIRNVVERELPGVPTVYTMGDVCRPDLLVEIEGIAYSRKPAAEQVAAA